MCVCICRPVARGGGSGGSDDPPPVAHPKDFVPPFSNFVPPFSNFVPPFSNFVPPLEYVDDVTRAMSKGGGVLVNVQEGGVFQFFGGRMTSRGQCPRGGACECPRVGAFFKLMTSRGQCPRGVVCAWCSTHPSSDPPPPHLAGWLATGLYMYLCIWMYVRPSASYSFCSFQNLL